MGGARIPVAKDVLDPSGGFYPNPRHWKRNTIIAFVALHISAYYVYKLSNATEVRYKPSRLPSKWAENSHDWRKEENDPYYDEMKERYHRTGKATRKVFKNDPKLDVNASNFWRWGSKELQDQF